MAPSFIFESPPIPALMHCIRPPLSFVLEVPVRIIDKRASIPLCRATTLHARTLEIFYDLGIVEEILAQGNKVLATSQFANGERFMQRLTAGPAGMCENPERRSSLNSLRSLSRRVHQILNGIDVRARAPGEKDRDCFL